MQRLTFELVGFYHHETIGRSFAAQRSFTIAIDAVLNLALVILCSVVLCMIVGMENTPALYLLIGSILYLLGGSTVLRSVKRDPLKLAVGMVLIFWRCGRVWIFGEGFHFSNCHALVSCLLLLLPTKLWILPSMLGSKLADSGGRVGEVFWSVTPPSRLCVDADPRDIHADRSGDFEHSLCSRLRSGLHVGCLDHLGVDCSFHRPKFSLLKNLMLSENRKYVMYGSQLLGGCVCLHLYLYRPDWILIELREFWFYIVMGVAFGTVGITEAARRLGDDLLVKELQRSAFLLPLIPIWVWDEFP